LLFLSPIVDAKGVVWCGVGRELSGAIVVADIAPREVNEEPA
jgi:hypothetical protein